MTVPRQDTPDDRWPRRVTLPGVRTLSIRPLRPSDTAGLVALYAGLKENDTYLRFFSGHAPPEDFVEKMTHVAERGGFGLIALMEEQDGTNKIVGEATYELLPNGDGELGITVAEASRGWLGPYLLDALVTEAAVRGVPNLEADVLVGNRRMLTMLRARGYAVMDHDPAIVRVAIGTDAAYALMAGDWRASQAARRGTRRALACRRGSSSSGVPGAGLPGTHARLVAMPGSARPALSSGGRCRRHHRRGVRMNPDDPSSKPTGESTRRCPSASSSHPEGDTSTMQSRRFRSA